MNAFYKFHIDVLRPKKNKCSNVSRNDIYAEPRVLSFLQRTCEGMGAVGKNNSNKFQTFLLLLFSPPIFFI